MEITRKEMVDKIHATKGQFFYVEFIKRSTGQLRKMTCHTRVQKYLKGGQAAYNFSEKGLISVADVKLMQAGDKRPYRAIPIEGLQLFRFNGITYTIKESK